MKHWILLLIAGVIAVVGGFLALLNPLAATLTATVLAAWLFIVTGIVLVLTAFGSERSGGKIWTVLLGLLAVLIGVGILGNPLAGVLALTWTVAILFLVEGVVKIILAFGTRGSRYFWPVLLSGAISVILAVMILSDFPQSATVILGVLLAVDLISTGVSMVALALHLKDGRQRI